MSSRRKTLASAVVAFLMVAGPSRSANQLEIQGVIPDSFAATLTINGVNFGASPVVTLGGQALSLQATSSTQVVATLPALAPGSYLLTMTSSGKLDQADVVIGAGGDITSVNVGQGLSGGAMAGDATLAVDLAFFNALYPRLGFENGFLAHQLMFGGLTLSGTVPESNNSLLAQSGAPDAFVISGLASSPTGQTRAITGTVASPQGAAVVGIAWPADGMGGTGGSFDTTGEGGVGLVAASHAATGTGHGANIVTNSPDGVAGWFLNQADGPILHGLNSTGEVFLVEGDGTVRAAAFTDLNHNPVGSLLQVDTGSGLVGGPITTTGTISVDFPVLDSQYARLGFTNGFQAHQNMHQGLGVSGLIPGTNNTLLVQSDDPTAFVISGFAAAETGQTRAITGTSLSSQSVGVVGSAQPINGVGGTGGSFDSVGEGGMGLEAAARATTGTGVGARITSDSPDGLAGLFQNSGDGQILSGFNGTGEVFRVEGDGTVRAAAFTDLNHNPVGSLLQVDTGSGLVGGPITTTGTISVDFPILDSQYARLGAQNGFVAYQQMFEGVSVSGLVPGTNNSLSAFSDDPTAFVISGWSASPTGQTRAITGTVSSSQAIAVVGTAWPANGMGGVGGNFDTTGEGGVGLMAASHAATGPGHGADITTSSPDGVAASFQNQGGGQILSGANSTDEVFRVEGDGTVRATAFTDLNHNPIGGVAEIDTGSGLVGGPITTSGSISVDFPMLDSQYARLGAPNGFVANQQMFEGLSVSGLVPGTNNSLSAFADDPTAFVISGWSASPTGQTRAITGTVSSSQSIAVVGIAWPADGMGGLGGSFDTTGEGGVGLVAAAHATTGTGHGANILTNSPDGVAGWFRNQGDGQILSGLNSTDEVFRVDGNGHVWATAYDEASSARYKTNIAGIEGAMEIVAQLRGVRYDSKRTGKRGLGLIAEEVAQVVPEVVSSDEAGANGVNYARLTALLVEALKEQQEQIRALERRLEELE